MHEKQPEIYPRALSGWFATWRWTFVGLTQVLFYGRPGCSGAAARPCGSTYDAASGEPRGSRSRRATPAAQGLGHCVDCTLCVQVCPTGIDILRNGLQNECIGCATCIDVCDGVMDRMGCAKGLTRYATENGVRHGWTRLQMFKRALRPRVLIYGAVLSAARVAFAASVALRSPFQFDVIKDRGALASVNGSGPLRSAHAPPSPAPP